MIDYDNEPLHRLEPAYLEHYGLTEPPFSALVDDRFYFSTAETGQRMSLLVHMTQYSDMVLMVLGDEGMGKTTLLQNYIKSAHDNWHICRITANSMMDKDQLLFRIAEDFGLTSLPSDAVELQEMVYDKLTVMHQNDVLPVIIVDDAHELSADALGMLFIMAEIKAGDVTMVHVVLFAEPQIDKTLNASNVKKISERISHTFELTPFDEADTADYILNRLIVAGLQGDNPFAAKVIRQIHKQSRGIPARINELAHIALDEAQTGEQAEYAELEDYGFESARLITPLRIFSVLTIALVAGLALWQQDRINRLFTGQDNPPATGQETDKPESPFTRLKDNMARLAPDQGDTPVQTVADTQAVTPAPETSPMARIEDPAIAAQLEATDTPLAPPVIDRLEPGTLTASRDRQTLTLHGQHFTPDTTVTLSWSGRQKQLPRSRIEFVSDKKIRVQLVTGKTPDSWQIHLADPAQGQSNTASFQVTAARMKQTATQWVDAQPGNNLTLQLLGSHNLKPIRQYIKQYQLSDEARVYPTRHAGKDWYVLLYGSFDGPQQAQQVADHLPEAARRHKPWIRSFASIRAPRQQSAATVPAAATDTGKTPTLNNIAAHEAWLWSQDPSHYTLQLLGTQSVNNIKQFIRQHQLRGKVVYYHTQRDNRDWYALLYGVYLNNTEAKTAAADLPAPIKKLSPWVRNFAAIHAEMDQAARP